MLERSTVDASQIQLLRRIAAGDREALADFYEQSANLLFSVAVRILGDLAEAEEVTQDVFVQIWNKAATFDEVLGVPSHWALGIVRNRCLDRLRARQRRHRVLEAVALESATVPQEEASAGRGLSEGEAISIRSAVHELPQDQRQAIEMAFFEGM